jgi:hypothetical protein
MCLIHLKSYFFDRGSISSILISSISTMVWNSIQVKLELYVCKSEGIAIHNIVLGTPQQNGAIELKNIIVLEKLHCILLIFRLFNTFWIGSTSTIT